MCVPGNGAEISEQDIGPLLDGRIDIHIEVVPVKYDKLSDTSKTERSESVRTGKGQGYPDKKICRYKRHLFKCADDSFDAEEISL